MGDTYRGCCAERAHMAITSSVPTRWRRTASDFSASLFRVATSLVKVANPCFYLVCFWVLVQDTSKSRFVPASLRPHPRSVRLSVRPGALQRRLDSINKSIPTLTGDVFVVLTHEVLSVLLQKLRHR